MTGDGHERHIVRVGDHQFRSGSHRCAWRNLEAHHQHAQRLVGRVEHSVLHPHGQIREIVRPERSLLLGVEQRAAAREHKVDLLLAWITDQRGASVRRQCQLAIASDPFQLPRLRISDTEDRLVRRALRGTREIIRPGHNVRDRAPQKGRVSAGQPQNRQRRRYRQHTQLHHCRSHHNAATDRLG